MIEKDRIVGVGIGVPGPVTPDGTVLKCVNLGWDVFNVERELSRLTGLPTKAANDANAAALGELWQGGGKGCRSIVLVTLGTGIGGGVILDGKIVSGTNGAAGEIGHIHVDDGETERCNCGNMGCLEQYASATGVVRMMRRALARQPDAAKAGDAAAYLVMQEVGKIFGKGLASVACVVDPEAFVVGGGMSKAGELLLVPVRSAYRTYVFHAARNARFVLAELGNDAGMYGCAKLVLNGS